jgi:hypothetical protein
MAGKRYIKVITPAGYEKIFAPGQQSDGVDPRLTREGVTLGAHASVFEVTGANLVEDNAKLKGLFVKFDHPLLPDPLLIEDSEDTGTPSFSLSAAAPVTVPAGTAFKIGPIESFWESGQQDAGEAREIKDWQQAHLMFEPNGNTQQFTAKFKGDGLAPTISGEALDNGNWAAGLHGNHVIQCGGKHSNQGRKGITQIPVMANDSRYVSVRFEHYGYSPFRILGYQIEATAKRSQGT